MNPHLPVVLAPELCLHQALLVMEENQTDCALVIKQDQKNQTQVEGVFTSTHLLKAIAKAIKSGANIDSFLTNTTVAEIAIAQQITTPSPPESDHFIEQQAIKYAKLERELANLKLATELNQIGCWNLNLITNKSEWNDIQFKLIGLPINPEIANYFSWRSHVHPEDIGMVEQEFSNAIALRIELEVRHRIIRENSEEIWVLTRGKPLYDPDGKPVSMVGVMVDINEAHRIRLALQAERKRNLALLQERELLLSSERQARESAEIANQEWRTILESITEGFMGINQQWQITHVNAALSQLCQIPIDQIIGSNFWQLFSESQSNQFEQCYQVGMETRTYQEIEGYDPNFKMWLQVRVFPSALGLSIFVRDLSEARKLAIERDRLFDYSRGIMAITDRSGVLTQINPAWQKVLGYDVQQSIGQRFLDFIYPPDREKTISHMLEMDATGKPQTNFEIRYCDQNGELVWLTWDCIPFPDEQKIYGFGRDITIRKKAEQELKRLNFSLEEKVEERTIELQETLFEKEILLKEIHHRVKNNLNLIDGLLNLQIHSIQNNQIKQLLQNNRDRIAIMGLVHQQLYQTERLNQVDLAEYIQSLCQNLYQVYVIQPDQISMEVEVLPEIVGIDTAVSIGLIINELLTNAFKHAFPNLMSGKVIVQCYRDAEQALNLCIKDNGIGTDLSLQKSTSLGIGLVKILAQQLHATVELKSNLSNKDEAEVLIGTNVHLYIAKPITTD